MSTEQEHNSPLAISYAQALFDLAGHQAEQIGQELDDLRGIVDAEPVLKDLLGDPAIGQTRRGEMIDRVFANRVSPLLVKFLHVANLKGRLGLLASFANAYDELLQARKGIVEADVTVVRRLDEASMENIRQRIGAALKREVVLHQYVDEKMLGGMILRVQDKMIDGSIRTQLQTLRQKLLEARRN
jgi:F-type H+-transporting ATPase subunit delta